MINQLRELVADHAQRLIINNEAIPDDKNALAIDTVTGGIADGLKEQVLGGHLQELLGMFKIKDVNALAAAPVVQSILTKVAAGLTSRIGISPSLSSSITNKLVPTVMSAFIQKTNDPLDNSFDLEDMLTKFADSSGLNVHDLLSHHGVTGSGSSTGLGDILGKMFRN